MEKSFDGMHENYDFNSIRFSVKKAISISISMIVTSVVFTSAASRLNYFVEHTSLVLVSAPGRSVNSAIIRDSAGFKLNVSTSTV